MAAFAYLDHNATSPLRPAAFDAMAEALRLSGNPSSVHRAGRQARSVIEASRRQVAAWVGALPAEVIFSSGGTEANNMAIAGAGRQRVLVSAVEHDSVLKANPQAERIPVDGDGVVDLAALQCLLAASREPALVSVMLANNETGVIQPIADVVRLARATDALVHCDAVQAAGKMDVDLHGLGVDYLSLSSHKLGGPAGIGALIVRAGAPFASDRRGGGQESNRRAGTENVAGIAGFGAAAAAALGALETERGRIFGLREAAETGLRAISPGVLVFGAAGERLPNTTMFAVPGVKADTALIALDLDGIAVSSGSACSSGKVAASHVLAAMGVEAALARGAIRVSMGFSTTEEDVKSLLAAWNKLVSALPRGIDGIAA